MIDRLGKLSRSTRPQFHKRRDRHLNPYFTFANYDRIWGLGVMVLGLASMIPLIAVTVIHYQLIQKSVDSELILRTDRVASNARRAVTFFLEERLNALRFTVNELDYSKLTNPAHLSEILKNLKLGFGGLSDLSVISREGSQIAYAGPFKLEGKNYSEQRWFRDCIQKDYYVSEIFRGYRDVPHIIVAVKSYLPNESFFILRATLETERLFTTLTSYDTGRHADIFLINRSGVIQTPSKYYGSIFEKIQMPVPDYSPRTQTALGRDRNGLPIITSYAFISPEITDTPFILMVVKQKEGMMGAWKDLHSKINWFVGVGALVILAAVTVTCTVMVNKMFLADKTKAETLAAVEQNNQLASIGQLAAGVAHEINNPLALINETAGYVKDLFAIKEAYRKDDELMEHIDSILEAVARCGRITRQLLGFARKFDIRIQKVNVHDVISDVLSFHDKDAAYRNIEVCVDVPQQGLEIESDRGKLQQVLLNLINNAFQAMNEGCRLNISARPEALDKVVIAVSDSGCGMSDENLRKIFEPFYSTKELGKGTGLGLTITQGLVKKLGGDIAVTSKLNEGTTFIVTLPRRIEEEPRP